MVTIVDMRTGRTVRTFPRYLSAARWMRRKGAAARYCYSIHPII